MEYYRFPERRSWKALFSAFLLVQLLLTRSGMSGMRLGFLPSQILMIGSIVLAGCIFLVVNRGNLRQIFMDSRVGVAAFFAIVTLLPMLIKQDWQLMYFTMLLGILLAIFLSYFVTLEQTAKQYVLIMCVLSAYSLLATYVLRIFPDRGIVDAPRFLSSNGLEYYSFGLANVSITHVASRNFGIFREPGVHQFFLLMALYLNNYSVSWEKERSMWLINVLLAVTMLSTMATGGVAALGLFVIVVYFEKKLYRNKHLLWLAVAVVAAAVVIVAVSFAQQNGIYWFLYDTLFEKFINKTDSVTERAEAIAVNWKLFLSSPVWGVRLSDVLHGTINNTVSTLILYAVYGVVGGTVNVLCWVALVWKKERQLWANCALLVILFMGFNTQNLTWDLYFWLFPVMALVERGIPFAKQMVR